MILGSLVIGPKASVQVRPLRTRVQPLDKTVPSLALLVEVGKALVKAPAELEANDCTRLNLSDHLDL
jgi:hypothetical protein